MIAKKTLAKRRVTDRSNRSLRSRPSIDPTRLALAAIERLKSILTRTGQAHKLAGPVTMKELVSRGQVLGQVLPPSYTAALRIASTIGEPEVLLDAAEMRAQHADMKANKAVNAERFVPFARTGERLVCFDREAPMQSAGPELPIIEWARGVVRQRARHFGEWLDEVADAREESSAQAAIVPAALKGLLLELGFRFDDPAVGRLETGDGSALGELLSKEQTKEIRGDVDRLFDSSGKASLTLNLEEFTLAVSLRTGIFVFEAEEVFRWLRWFRDESFFEPPVSPKASTLDEPPPRKPAHPDRVRDLRKAAREAPLILRGVVQISTMPAQKHTFRAASGSSARDFYLLGRTASRSDRATSLILHVVDGAVRDAHAIEEPLNDLYVAADGTTWGLSVGGSAIRLAGGSSRSYPLYRQSRGRTWWYGIGGAEDRVLAWGAGALLEFDGEEFVPFAPDPALDDGESVPALVAQRRELQMLVVGDRVGAVARFDGKKWLPIPVANVLEGALADLDVWRGVGIVLGRGGEVWRIEEDAAPRPVIWDTSHQAFIGESGARRATHAVRGYDGGALVASDGGVIVVGQSDPIFFSAGVTNEPARLARVGGGTPINMRRSRPNMKATEEVPGLVAMCGPHVWLWNEGTFNVLDLREW
jgi:hypothetical protein